MRLAPALCLALAVLPGCATVGVRPGGGAMDQEFGTASYYDAGYDGHRSASGLRYDARGLTAAHRTLPFGTRVRVTNLANGRNVVVTITDRGPFRSGRVIDVSRRAAELLGFARAGLARVRVDVLDG
jgi:peptidoglycan lytic transglycosylase